MHHHQCCQSPAARRSTVDADGSRQEWIEMWGHLGADFRVGFEFEGGGRPPAATVSSGGSGGRGARGRQLLVAAARSPRGRLGSVCFRGWSLHTYITPSVAANYKFGLNFKLLSNMQCTGRQLVRLTSCSFFLKHEYHERNTPILWYICLVCSVRWDIIALGSARTSCLRESTQWQAPGCIKY
jgi:hypothetical protein